MADKLSLRSPLQDKKTLTVIGGCYLERVLEPQSNVVFGSGLRAAAAIASSASVQLVTWADSTIEIDIASASTIYGFKTSIFPRPSTIGFTYHTPISLPRVTGNIPGAFKESPSLSSQYVLVFGTLEPEISVTAEAIVFDPQTHHRAPLNRQSLVSDRFAVVANQHEILALSGESDTHKAAMWFIEHMKADAVVVKRGALGAVVVESNGESTQIPVYATGTVWPIGSGDVFSAVFAWGWLINDLNSKESAELASAATSRWCSTKTLPLPLPKSGDPIEVAIGEKLYFNSKPKVYLAGPFFTLSDRWLLNVARDALVNLGADVFSPFHEIGFGGDEVAEPDIRGLVESESVFALVDTLDSGTMFEVGFAKSNKTPVVAYTLNPRRDEYVMLRGLDIPVIDDLASSIYLAIWLGYNNDA